MIGRGDSNNEFTLLSSLDSNVIIKNPYCSMFVTPVSSDK
jgi:hypothetical protein